jgi:hypothetical protein
MIVIADNVKEAIEISNNRLDDDFYVFDENNVIEIDLNRNSQIIDDFNITNYI